MTRPVGRATQEPAGPSLLLALCLFETSFYIASFAPSRSVAAG